MPIRYIWSMVKWKFLNTEGMAMNMSRQNRRNAMILTHIRRNDSPSFTTRPSTHIHRLNFTSKLTEIPQALTL